MSKPLSNLEKMRKNPAKFYHTPEEVIHDDNLTPNAQNEILKSWEDDITALLRAESENMPAAENQSQPADLLSRISKLRTNLKQKS